MKRSLPGLILLSIILAGCATTKEAPPGAREALPGTTVRPPVASLSVSPYPSFKTAVDTLLADSLFPPSNVGIKIVSLTKHDTLYALNPDMLFNPASNQKLISSATALSVLGKGYLFPTIIAVHTPTHTVYLKGFGDPLVTTENLDSLAKLISPRLKKKGRWRIAADISYFDDLFRGEGWRWDDEPSDYSMYITPLALNGNTIKVNVRPGKRKGGAVRVTTTPVTDYVSVENRGRTVTDSIVTPLEISRKWRERSNVITVEGEMLRGRQEVTTSLSVWQPERYAARVFAELLKHRGVRVSGTVVDTLVPAAAEVARFSHSLDSVVVYLNKESDNLSGETLLKTMGAEKRMKPGSAIGGASVVKEFLAKNNIDTTRMAIADGSGLSRYNLTSPSAIARLLELMHTDTTNFDLFYRSFPIAGVDGTLAKRMNGTRAEGNLRAKTGTINGASALSGYVQTIDGEMLAFSIMMQNFVGSAGPYRDVQDRIGVLLSELSRKKLKGE